MNRSRTLFASLFGVGATILLVIILVVSANRFQSTLSSENVSAASTGYPVPTDEPYPVGTTSGIRVVEPNERPLEPTPTIIPNAANVFQGQLVQVIYPNVALDYISEDYNVFGDYLIGEAQISNEGRSLIQVDLQTGMTDILVGVDSAITDFSNIAVSAEHIVWTSDNNTSLYLLARDTRTYELLHQGATKWQVDVNAGLIVWVDASGISTINLHNVETEQLQEIIEAGEGDRLGYPRICSSDWLVYLHDFANSTRQLGTTPATLSLYHIPTGDTTAVGDVTNAPTIPIDRNRTFDCDQNRLVWVKMGTNRDDSSPQAEMYIHNFSQRSAVRVSGFSNELPPSPSGVSLESDIVFSRIGYDLRHDAPFTIFVDKHAHWGALHLSNQRIVWSEFGQNDTAKAIYVVNITDGGR